MHMAGEHVDWESSVVAVLPHLQALTLMPVEVHLKYEVAPGVPAPPLLRQLHVRLLPGMTFTVTSNAYMC